MRVPTGHAADGAPEYVVMEQGTASRQLSRVVEPGAPLYGAPLTTAGRILAGGRGGAPVYAVPTEVDYSGAGGGDQQRPPQLPAAPRVRGIVFEQPYEVEQSDVNGTA